MSKVFGAVTIGQAPRPDITNDILAALGSDYAAVERGALDGLSRAEIERLAPAPGEDVLVTRLSDGSQALAAERLITPLVEQKVNQLFGEGIAVVVLLCTGHFPGFTARGTLLRPQELINRSAAALGLGRLTGVLCPTPGHIPQMKRQWRDALGAEPLVLAASPYQGMGEVEAAAFTLREAGVQVAAMDCLAYTAAMKERVAEITGAEVLLPRLLAAVEIRRLMEGML